VRIRIKNILNRLANSEEVTLQERIYVGKFADKDQTVASWLSKAKQIQKSECPSDPIEAFINDLGIGTSDPHSSFEPDQEDLGDWFSGAPSWITRS
tara:strand:- start:1193 stop:1480 length:288 start_codon:yes stop_codon:yes gene_type:complete